MMRLLDAGRFRRMRRAWLLLGGKSVIVANGAALSASPSSPSSASRAGDDAAAADMLPMMQSALLDAAGEVSVLKSEVSALHEELRESQADVWRLKRQLLQNAARG
uniref:Uncharacterized protein n=1 Tax=Bicosoecida sp. CB-2014 TaxID=1486930 RepID=A0A7S1C3I4_9STRA